MDNLADGFLDALEAEFEVHSATAFQSPKQQPMPKAALAEMSDFTEILGSLPRSPTFPEMPNTDAQWPRPRSKQRTGSRGGSRGAPREGSASVIESPAKDEPRINAQALVESSLPKQIKDNPTLGWTYKKGWSKRPRKSAIDEEKMLIERKKRAVLLHRVRDEREKHKLWGKGKAANFSQPLTERLRPKGYGSKDLNRLKLIAVDVSAAKNPGPRYIVDPQPSRQELKKTRAGKIILPNSSLSTGQSKSFGMKLPWRPTSISLSSVADPDLPPSLDSFSRLGTAESASMLAERNALPGPRLDNAGRLHYGSIYYDEMNAGGPGPGARSINDAFLKTSSIITAERATFSPPNSQPGSPVTSRPNSRPSSRQRGDGASRQ